MKKGTKLALRPGIVIFSFSSFVDAVGTGTFMAGQALFFVRTVGLTAAQVSIGVTAAALLGLLATMPWGHAARRFGAKPIYVLLLAARGVCFVAYVFVHNFPEYMVLACLIGMMSQPASPIQQEMVARVTDGVERQQALGWIRSTRNLGFTVGAGIAAVASTTALPGGYRLIVLVNAASFFGAAALSATISVPKSAPKAKAGALSGTRGMLRDRRYFSLILVNGALTSHMILLGVGLPLWILKRTPLPPVAVPMTIIINTVLAVIFQVPVANRIRSSLSAGKALVLTGFLLAGCCAAAAGLPFLRGAAGIAVAALAAVLLTAGELVQSAAGWKLSFDLAPEDDQRPVYLARFSLALTGNRLLLPLLLTAVVFPLGGLGWLLLGGVLVLCGAFAPHVVRMNAPEVPAAAPPVTAGAATAGD
jgi:MFS family permease